MTYYEGIDYWVRYVEFPNMASESVVASHGDGTFTIYVNTLFSPERQADRLAHEIRHLIEEHFYRDDVTITQVERQADGFNTPSIPAIESRVLPGDAPRFSVFRSNDVPEWATFAFYVPDNSFRPVFKKNTLLYCESGELQPGDIGLFNWQGNTVCRQYHKDIFGITYLFALNRDRENEDIILRSCEENKLICYGKIRMKKRLPLPL